MVDRTLLRAAICIGLILLCAGPARADYKAGQRAWDAGRHAQAVAQWKAAAKANDGRAMLALGRAFVKGLGVPQDYVEAHKWLNLAAGQGVTEAAGERDALAAQMTAEERTEARKLARAWRQSAKRTTAKPGKAETGKAKAGKAERGKATAAAENAAAVEAALGLTLKERRQVQAALASLGYEPGPADGAFGPTTRAALRSWQKAAGLKATGRLTQRAVGMLKAAEKAAKAQAIRAEAARKKAERKSFDLQWPAGKQFQDCAVCPQMVVVPAGSFTMGGESAGPRHRVTIRQRFAVGKYEIAFAEWDACVKAGGCGGHRAGDRNWGRGQRPAINASWRDARSYVRWLRQLTGQPYRLLSEAEWEYAARAGTRTAYPWGVAAGRNRANCKGCGSRWDGRKTAQVGTFPVNGFGLRDMHGNVREWVEDCWHGSYRGAPADGSAWTEGGDCRRRVLRSGSWNEIPWDIRSASRLAGKVKARNSKSGFRIALTLDP